MDDMLTKKRPPHEARYPKLNFVLQKNAEAVARSLSNDS